MADLSTHKEFARQLNVAMRRAIADGHWPIVVDAGFYAVYHTMEALNAVGCRDSYNFADAIDILERVLVPRVVSQSFMQDYEYLFYFRRGALYGPHFLSQVQLDEYVATSERAYGYILSVANQQAVAGTEISGLTYS